MRTQVSQIVSSTVPQQSIQRNQINQIDGWAVQQWLMQPSRNLRIKSILLSKKIHWYQNRTNPWLLLLSTTKLQTYFLARFSCNEQRKKKSSWIIVWHKVCLLSEDQNMEFSLYWWQRYVLFTLSTPDLYFLNGGP